MSQSTHVRFGHCSTDAPAFEVLIDGELRFERVEFGTLSSYAELPVGTHEVQITPVGEETPVIVTNLRFDGDSAYSVLAIRPFAEIEAMVLTDEPGTPSAADSHVRFVHTVPDGSPLDVKLRDGRTLFEDVPPYAATDYHGLDAGEFDIDVYTAGSDVTVLELTEIELVSGRSYTVVAVGTFEDTSLSALVSTDWPASQSLNVE